MSKRKILITGKGSYVGTNFIKWLEQWPDQYEVVELSVRGTEWKDHDFSVYDVVLHVAGIVHLKENPHNQIEYFKVNKDLTLSIADKAMKDGVKQFIFMSSMSVYGIEGSIGKDVLINQFTECHPTTYYGKSKLAAEEILTKKFANMKISIIRAPMIYGPNCPGNYLRLRRASLIIPIFPLLTNKRSMIFIDNLSEFLRWIIFEGKYGVFFPQNQNYVSTNQLVKLISSNHNKKVVFSKILSIPIKLFGNKFIMTKKIFGSLQYDLTMSLHNEYDYCVSNFENSIKESEIDR